MRKILEFYRTQGVMIAVEKRIREMFKIGRELYQASSLALLENKEVGFDLYAKDREVNLHVVEIRKKIVEHLSISSPENLSGELVFLKVITDLERVGDYTKNILDLTTEIPEQLPDSDCLRRLKKLIPVVDDFFIRAENGLFEDKNEDAEYVMDNNLTVNRTCQDILSDLMRVENRPPWEVIALALAARYFKRVGAHLKNVASTAVNPFPHIGYVVSDKDESEEEKD